MSLTTVILAAGKGTRMRSALPKVLHKVAGKPMVQHVIDNAKALGATSTNLVFGHGGELLQQQLADNNVNWVLQAERWINATALGQNNLCVQWLVQIGLKFYFTQPQGLCDAGSEPSRQSQGNRKLAYLHAFSFPVSVIRYCSFSNRIGRGWMTFVLIILVIMCSF